MATKVAGVVKEGGREAAAPPSDLHSTAQHSKHIAAQHGMASTAHHSSSSLAVRGSSCSTAATTNACRRAGVQNPASAGCTSAARLFSCSIWLRAPLCSGSEDAAPL